MHDVATVALVVNGIGAYNTWAHSPHHVADQDLLIEVVEFWKVCVTQQPTQMCHLEELPKIHVEIHGNYVRIRDHVP